MTSIDKVAYSQLLTEFQPKVIETHEEYDTARRAILRLMTDSNKTLESKALIRLLATLIKDFDDKQEKATPASPHEVLQHLMESKDMKQSDLVGRVASKGVISEIVNGKRQISKKQAKILGEIFRVSPALFI